LGERRYDFDRRPLCGARRAAKVLVPLVSIKIKKNRFGKFSISDHLSFLFITQRHLEEPLKNSDSTVFFVCSTPMRASFAPFQCCAHIANLPCRAKTANAALMIILIGAAQT
jgi:hypothetical protein